MIGSMTQDLQINIAKDFGRRSSRRRRRRQSPAILMDRENLMALLNAIFIAVSRESRIEQPD